MSEHSPEILALAARKGVVWDPGQIAWRPPGGRPAAARRMFSPGWLTFIGGGQQVHTSMEAALSALPDVTPAPPPEDDRPAADRVAVSPGVLHRLEALGYSPGTANPVSWVVDLAERQAAELAAIDEALDLAGKGRSEGDRVAAIVERDRRAAEVVVHLGEARAEIEALTEDRDAWRKNHEHVTARMMEWRAKAQAARPAPPPSGTVEERIAALCGLVRGEDEVTPGQHDWRTPPSAGWPTGEPMVWRTRSTGEWAWETAWGESPSRRGREPTEEAALRAYAAARGVDLAGLDAPTPNPDRAQVAALGAQPAPSGGTGDCWRELIDDLPAHLAHLAQRCEDRRAFGIRKYGGVPVTRGDGRNPHRDLDEELLDGAVYAWRLGYRALAWELLAILDNPTGYAARRTIEQRMADDMAAHVCCPPWAGRERKAIAEALKRLRWQDEGVVDVLAALLGVEVTP